MATITLSKGFTASLDDADLDRVSPWKWHVQDRFGLQYARRNTEVRGRTHSIYMHRLILGAGQGDVVDHIDGNGLNNFRSNLRFVSHAGNLRNRRAKAAGISWSRRYQKWRAIVDHDGDRIEVGYFADQSEAEAARSFMTHKLRGDPAPHDFDYLLLSASARKFLVTSRR